MVKKWNVKIPQLSGNDTRRVYLYLPDLYYEEQDRRFPVMYMFDGHNVFFDSDATYGKSWGMNKYMSSTRTPLIIVAVIYLVLTYTLSKLVSMVERRMKAGD